MDTKSSDRESQIADLGKKYDFSAGAVEAALTSLQRTGGGAAQFNNSEMGGSVQWMRGGMTQIGDMFNSALKDRVSRLCADLSARLQDLAPPAPDSKSNHKAKAEDSSSEWPAAWGSPSSAGGQNGVRYAFFPSVRRLAVEENGKKTIYDTKDHRINGVSQQQGSQSRLAFSTQDGPVDISKLSVVTE